MGGIMRASVFVGISVDGYMARPDGRFDFLPEGGGEPHGYDEFIATVDVLVMGRNTYEVVLPFNPWPYGAKPVFVLSSRELKPAPAGAVVERLSATPAEVVRHLDRRGFKHAYVDGGLTIQAFLRAGLIERLTVTRVPVLIGRGIALFGDAARDIRLRHVATTSYLSGMVKSEYDVLS
jgi:dihydrofolate reductase